MPLIAVRVPDASTCQFTDGKQCPFLRWERRRKEYSCKRFGGLLAGGDFPLKNGPCKRECERSMYREPKEDAHAD